MEPIVSAYAPGIAILLLVLSPLLVPIAVTLLGGVIAWRAKGAVMKQDRQRKAEPGKAIVASARPRLRTTRGGTASAAVETALPEVA
jgi:hypothetical protein